MSVIRDPNHGLVELASGIDALYLSGRAALSETLLRCLDDGRTSAEEAGCPLEFGFGGVEFAIAPHGFGRYRYCLTHPNGQIGVSPSGRLPTFRIQPRAEFLHGVGPSSALSWFRSLLESECGDVKLTVSRVDLFCDVEGFDLCVEDRRRFLCRATTCRTNEDDGTLTGFEFGRRTSKSICARLYDKTAEIEHSGAGYVTELWGSHHTSGAQVWRIEFEIGRVALSEFGVQSPEQAIERAGELWRYCTGEWLSLRTETADQTKARWPVDPAWSAIEAATFGSGALGATRLRCVSRAKVLERLLPGLVGYLSSFAALVGTSGITDTCGALARTLRGHDQNLPYGSGRSFAERIAKKVRQAALS